MRPTYANTTATLALILALGGTGAYAAGQIKAGDIAKNAVRAKHIKANQVKAKHIKANQVKSKHIADGQVTGSEVVESSLGQVPSAASVGGVTITPFARSLASGANGGDLVSIGGSRFEWSCTGSAVDFEFERSSTSDPVVMVSGLRTDTPDEAYVETLTSGGIEVQAPEASGLDLDVTFREASGKVTTIDFRAFYDNNGIGSDDCFAQGEIRTFGG